MKSLKPKFEWSVFINCPYDPDYRPTFETIVLATVCCGFIPRPALDSDGVSDSRLDRIYELIRECKYSIHDLSRCYGEGTRNLARFNMPIELGMAIAQNKRGSDSERSQHEYLVLVPDDEPASKFASDLQGLDPKAYDLSQGPPLAEVMSWLVTSRDAADVNLNPAKVRSALPRFHDTMRELRHQWDNSVPWQYVVDAATHVAQQFGFASPHS